MKTEDDILKEVGTIFRADWHRSEAQKVPDQSDVLLGENDAKEFEGVVLYADMRESTKLVREYKDYFAAEMYKAFLFAAGEVIKNNDGVITSFDGDRIMAVFIGKSKCTNATKAGLQIYAIVRKINERMAEKYHAVSFRLDFAVGIDMSRLFVIRTGIRGSNYLAWIGDAANIAAKLSEVRNQDGHVYITDRVYQKMNDSSKYSASDGKGECMWSLLSIIVEDQKIYSSTWYWDF